ncbi:hypothetical protein [Dyella acidiphila]|uniref:Transposase n=1 Tax=Dyella acidiphila TaxID=2775866 RepID=A0ABR9GBH0_9GAMM|nr:hypothetical protein [Dyella acidiphila]MBE1161397.1 hypothetical protein [Dyella acidiphila]
MDKKRGDNPCSRINLLIKKRTGFRVTAMGERPSPGIVQMARYAVCRTKMLHAPLPGALQVERGRPTIAREQMGGFLK